jgi:SAM-dependent methyltransferase
MWDERYASAEYAYGTEPNDFLAEMARALPQGHILCLAEGEGRNAVHLATLGYQVTAVDASAVGLAKAQHLARQRGVALTTVVADLADFTIEAGQWDGIVSIFCHLPPALRRRVHRAVVEGLRPGGVLVLEAYTPKQLDYNTGGPPVAEMTMTLEQLQTELKGLAFCNARETVRPVIEGRYHHGDGAVVQLVAEKPLLAAG